MKRRVLGLMIALALCLNLCPVWVLAAGGQTGDSVSSFSILNGQYTLETDESVDAPYPVSKPLTIDTNGHTWSAPKSSALQVTDKGELHLMGTVTALNGNGVEVQSGGSLKITGESTNISASAFALDIASGASVQLSAGKYFGRSGAIRTADGNYAALLAEGCAYFDADDSPMASADVAKAKTVIVRPCTAHSNKSYAHASGATEHTWTCLLCGTKEPEMCTFDFDQSGHGTGVCGNFLTIAVDEDSLGTLDYTDTIKPANGIVTATLGDGTQLSSGDYKVTYSMRASAGDTSYTVTVTVDGVAYNGTFTKDYLVNKADQPVLEWTVTSPVTLDYTGSPVPESELPVKINITSGENLRDYLQYSYKEQGSAGYIDGLPTNAGTYEVVVTLPEQPGGSQAVSSAPITLVISKISPIVTAPSALNLTYDGTDQELVSAGTLHSAAARDGVEIQYATEKQGPYSTSIPTGLNAKDYTVWYQTAETDNYEAVAPTKVSVKILPKSIQPTIEPKESSYPYDGAKHEPKITVKDGKTVIDEDQYTVTWTNDDPAITTDILTAAGKYTAAITNVSGGNYTFTAAAKVEIVEATQGGLTISGRPEHVYYGDRITTLHTIGGSGEGTVTWTVTDANDNPVSGSTITATGELTVKNTGSLKVKAERAVPNYGTVSDTWTFTVEPKPVTAEVTIAAKDYDSTTAIDPTDIAATVNASDLVYPSDTFTISGLEGAYTDANAGTGKTVTLDASKAATTADTAKYAVSYPTAVKADINRRRVTVTVTLSGNDLKTDASGSPYYDYDGTDKTPTVTVTGTATGSYNAPLASSDYTFTYANNKNVGTASVTVKCAADGNYDFPDKTVTFEIKGAAAKLTSTPQAKNLTYDGTLQDLVTVGVATGGTVVYSLSPIDPANPNTYSETIPQGRDADVYTVYYMVKGDANHGDAGGGYVSVTIGPKEITPKITLSTSSYVYSGSECKPTVTVEDGTDTIPASEYSVSYRDNINAGTATVIVSDKNRGNYIVNGTAEFTITKAAPTYTAPKANTGLYYTGALQDLVTAGVTSHGTVVYSVGGGNYTTAIPAASAVDTYTIDYKVKGDANHNDTTPVQLTVSIAKNTVNNPTISLSKDTFRYDGTPQKPDITVYDNGRLIPQYEYEVDIKGATSGNTGIVNVDTYTVTITATASSNYVFTGNKIRTYQIVPADQETISITGTQARVCYGDEIQLGTTGGTGSGTVTWTITGATSSTITNGGLLTVRDVGGSITVTAERSMGSNYDNISATWEFSPASKPVTAVVTASDRNYIAGDNAAAVTATVPNSELVSGDSINITGLSGTFDDDSAGTNKKVTIDSSSVSLSGTNWEKYDITYPAAATASILASAATVDTAPQAVSGLTYDASQSQALVTAGTPTGGDMVYSLDGTNFTLSIPTGKEAKAYTVYFKVRGDSNHTDSPVGSVQVTIARQTVAPQIELSPPRAQYDGQVKQPQVTLRDSANNVIPTTEYKVTYVSDNGENWTDQDTYTVKVENITGGNYVVDTKTADFIISTTVQAPLEITNKPGLVYYGDTFTLSTVGGSGSGTVTWSSTDTNIADVDPNGFVTIKGVGSATITATRPGGANYDDATATYPLNALRKPITAIVTADDRVYASGVTTATIHVTWKAGDLVGNDVLNISNLTGAFRDEHVGTNKTVDISGTVVSDSTAQKYDITIPPTTTASINRAFVELDKKPEKVPNLVYTGSSLSLITGGSTKDGIGTIEYSLKQYGEYSTDIPTAVEAGTYSVWYKVEDNKNYVGIPATEIEVEIAAVPSDGDTETPPETGDGTETTPPETGGDTETTPPETGGGTDTSGSSGTSGTSTANTGSAPMRTTVQNGTASTVVSAAGGSKLVREAAANQSESIVIKPEITSSVTKAQVSVPASTVSQIGNETDAALTISAPIADVTIPNGALNTLGRAGGTVNVVTEQVDQAVVLTLTAGGENVESLPGGVTLTVPVEDAGPGTVAVLVHDDGTREVVRKSVAEDGKVNIPLSGSATVEIVDNSKDFADVPSTSWAADAVAFASAHELFSGTSETTFSPDQAMSRGMLATVLYSLEGRPEQDLTMEEMEDAFSDVSGGAWYADAVTWITENGIASGYGDGQFGPNDSVTREQFAVMLWKYAGSPKAERQVLDFADGDQASGYALEALCWATENGILNGSGNGQLDPGGTATRAQAAQMLKNFIENT